VLEAIMEDIGKLNSAKGTGTKLSAHEINDLNVVKAGRAAISAGGVTSPAGLGTAVASIIFNGPVNGEDALFGKLKEMFNRLTTLKTTSGQ
jgi:hypothetical protein